jgi:pimeloyl-ACP methyl ester carboxylesterase
VDYRDVAFREFTADYVTEILDREGIDETAVLGNSLGGFQTLALSPHRPDRVTRQCLVGAPAGLSRSIPVAIRLLVSPVIGWWLFERVSAQSIDDTREAFRQLNVVDATGLPDLYFRPGLVGNDLPGRRESLWSLLQALVSFRGVRPTYDVRAAVRDIELPTRFVWGAEDGYWSPSVGKPVAEDMTDAELVVLDDHGHMPWLEPAEAATDAALAFLTSG